MLKVNAQEFLKIDYNNISLKTSGFYAAPESDAQVRQQLFETLQALFKQEPADTFFALSMMLTMGEIMIAPLGVLDLEAVKQFGANQQLDYTALTPEDQLEWPLAVRFISHTPDADSQETTVASGLELKADFAQAFEALWAAVKQYLDLNQTTMTKMLATLIEDSTQVEGDFYQELSKLDAKQRAEKVGFELADGEVTQFTKYMSDSHEVMNIVRSAADFVKSELVQDQAFAQIFNDAHYRSTYYWVLDNTFYELYYYYIQKYSADSKVEKYLKHREADWLTQMRQTALKGSQQVSEQPKANLNPDVAALFDHIFLPLNEKILTGIFGFDDENSHK
ncbi:hypothetical protein ACFQ5M_07175 [Agrilactobacillus yilanensis]|uniref:Uncharacterized protein n=1 Tax=Agrilactobacillus yilanensis TaxID=2485997 RepID=A0ABW4J7B7_9LACO|nr:hypothetical protein [Agrilactobacillus yilanensis]